VIDVRSNQMGHSGHPQAKRSRVADLARVDQVVTDVRQVVSAEREDARHGVKIERRQATN
jgi:hypothetical protein